MAKWEYYEKASEEEINADVALLIDVVAENPCEICNKCADNEKTNMCQLAKRLRDAFKQANPVSDELDYFGG